ncbi:unnamed protein product [Lupinus luteus]|uniref:Uncharacterized protein n=1 Tax=Lupinus luteus TaxID=3873 RepID=A0AAV1WFX4_LUPLU
MPPVSYRPKRRKDQLQGNRAIDSQENLVFLSYRITPNIIKSMHYFPTHCELDDHGIKVVKKDVAFEVVYRMDNVSNMFEKHVRIGGRPIPKEKDALELVINLEIDKDIEFQLQHLETVHQSPIARYSEVDQAKIKGEYFFTKKERQNEGQNLHYCLTTHTIK